MGRQSGDQSRLFYFFDLERHFPAGHLLRRIKPLATEQRVDMAVARDGSGIVAITAVADAFPATEQRACL